MQTLKLDTVIGPDGHLRLDVATQLPPGKAEVVIVASPAVNGHGPRYDFSDLAGRLQWQGDAVAEQRRLRDEW
jgi:hypothetical protein